MKKIIFKILILFPSLMFSQLDSLKGNIKAVREKLIFLDDQIQNEKLFSSEGDYGHYGFVSSEFTFSRFNSWWFDTPWVHYLNYSREYNKDKKIINETWFYKNDTVSDKFSYQYDVKDNLIQIKEYFKDGSFSVTNNSYNQFNKIISTVTYYSNNPKEGNNCNYLYNDKNKLLETKKFDEDGELVGNKYEYNENGKRIKIYIHSPFVVKKNEDGSSTEEADSIGSDYLESEFVYNELGKLGEMKFFNEDEGEVVMAQKNTYKYNQKQKKIAEYYSRDTVYAFREFKYYSNKLLKEEKYFQINDKKSNYKVEYFYNNKNLIIKVIYTEVKKKSIIVFKYKFDSYNNWVEQVKIIDTKPLFLRKRELTYY